MVIISLQIRLDPIEPSRPYSEGEYYTTLNRNVSIQVKDFTYYQFSSQKYSFSTIFHILTLYYEYLKRALLYNIIHLRIPVWGSTEPM